MKINTFILYTKYIYLQVVYNEKSYNLWKYSILINSIILNIRIKNTHIGVNDYIDIHKAKDYQELLKFLAKPIPFCKYCDVKNRRDGITWKVSTKSIEEYLLRQ